MNNKMERKAPDLQDVGPDTAEAFLLSFGSENPAALALLGIHYLKRWKSSGNTQYLEQGRDALKEAARQGEPEANWQLYSYVIQEGTRKGRSNVPSKYLLEKKAERKKFLIRAARSGHKSAIDHINSIEDESSAFWENEGRYFREEEPYIRLAHINSLRQRAQQEDKYIQMQLASELIDSWFDTVLYGFQPEKGHFRRQEAKELLEAAATEVPEARFMLVVNGYINDETAAIDLLRAAAFPKQGETPYPKALMELATKLAERREYAEAEKCLREAISQGVNAETKLANLIYEHHDDISGDLAEALSLYELLADRSKDSLTAFRAGQMHLRGEVCPQDLNKARHYFEIGAQSDQETHDFSDPESRAGLPLDWFDDHVAPPLYCKLALVLGWPEESGVITSPIQEGAHILLDRLAQRHCQDEMYDFLQYRDVICLLKHWNRYQPLSEAIGQEELEILLSPLLGLIRILSEKRIKDTDSNRYFDLNESVLEDEKNLALGWLLASGRLGVVDLEKAEHHFQTVLRRLPDIKKSYWGREDALSDRETSFQRISRLTQKGLRYCSDQRVLKIQAEKAAEVQLAEERTRTEVIENMLAMFAHKFRGPLDSILFNTTHQRDERIYVDAAQTMNGLLDMFSMVSASPERLREGCLDDLTGDATPLTVLNQSLKQALMQLLSGRNRLRMSPHYLAYAKRQGAAPTDLSLTAWSRDRTWVSLETKLQSQWEEEIGGLIPTADIDMLADWMAAHLLPLSIQGFQSSGVNFSAYGLKASLLTVVFQEILVNALKHSTPGATEPVRLSWLPAETDDAYIVFSCANPSTLETRRREKSKGSGRGHKFLALLAGNLGGHLEVDVMRNDSKTSMFFARHLFEGDRK